MSSVNCFITDFLYKDVLPSITCTTLKQYTDNLLSVNDSIKFMFIVQIAMYRYDMYAKVVYDNFNN